LPARLSDSPPTARSAPAAFYGETQADVARTYAVSHVTIGRLLGTVGSPFDGASVAAT